MYAVYRLSAPVSVGGRLAGQGNRLLNILTALIATGDTTTASVENAGAWVYIQAVKPARNPAKRIKASDPAMSAS